MLRYTIKILSVLIFILARIIVLGLPLVLTPLMILYASHLNAESQKEKILNPDLIAIPMPLKPINKGTMILESDLGLQEVNSNLVNDMIAQDNMQLIGQEAKKSLYKNKPILLRDIGSVTIIRRNDTVTMTFKKGSMILETVGRAMQDGGAGDSIKVMNEHSKKMVTGRITQNGEVDVSL